MPMSDLALPAPTNSDALPTVLIVEDEALVRLAFAEYLRACGYMVFEANSIAEAKAVLDADTRVDLVFSDVQMPGAAEGFALASWIRQHPPDIKVILTSGLTGAAQKARDLCHDGPFVANPISTRQSYGPLGNSSKKAQRWRPTGQTRSEAVR